MPQKLRLIGQGNFYITINHDALTAQARVNAWIYRPINKVFFFFGYFLQTVNSFINIYMAGTTATNATAIML